MMARCAIRLDRCGRSTERRGILLVVVLVIITVLGLLGASFSYWMNADLSALTSMLDRQQARLAAESGVERAILLLRDERTNMDNWYNNPDVFRRILVWAPGRIGGSENLADQEKIEGQQAWRFSVVSYEVDGDDAKIRYGLTDEAGKLNLNVADAGQLLALFNQLEIEDVTPEELASTLTDWCDADNDQVSSLGAESSYYMTLDPPYKAKNGPLQTIEELLTVKGFNGLILYGEDYNRNGYLDDNENDGPEGLFPPDDGDGILDRGLLSYITVFSWDMNSANDNKIRLNINGFPFDDPEKLPDSITEELSPEIIDFIAKAQKRKYKFKSIGELIGLEVFEDGSSNYDAMWKEFNDQRAKASQISEEAIAEESSDQEDQEADNESQESGSPEDSESDSSMDRQEEGNGDSDQNAEDDELDSEGKGRQRRQQAIRDNESDNQDNSNEDNDRSRRSRSSRSSSRNRSSRDSGDKAKSKGTPVVSPATASELAILVDRLTVSSQPVQPGLINVNTASLAVLRTIPGLTEDEAQAIVGRRKQVSGEEKMTTAWLVSAGALEAKKFALISNLITARSIQFSMDVIGFADHVGTACRLQAVVEMRGQLAQLRYYRDITALGMGYPVWDDQRSEGFSFEDR